MNAILAIIYLFLILILLIIILKILLESNFHVLFKQGKIFHIRLSYLLVAFAISYLVASGIIKIIELLLIIGQN